MTDEKIKGLGPIKAGDVVKVTIEGSAVKEEKLKDDTFYVMSNPRGKSSALEVAMKKELAFRAMTRVDELAKESPEISAAREQMIKAVAEHERKEREAEFERKMRSAWAKGLYGDKTFAGSGKAYLPNPFPAKHYQGWDTVDVSVSSTRPSCSPAAMHTAHGGMFDILQPHTDDVHLPDIAHHLARINRFTGAIKFQQYSVAQHSVICSWAARLLAPELELHALLHDAHEAYIGDISSPMKKAIEMAGGKEVIKRIEKPIIETVWAKLGYGAPRGDQLVHAIDIWCAYREFRDILDNPRGPHWEGAFDAMKLFSPGQLAALDAQVGRIKSGWPAEHAEKMFIDTYRDAIRRSKDLTVNVWIDEYADKGAVESVLDAEIDVGGI